MSEIVQIIVCNHHCHYKQRGASQTLCKAGPLYIQTSSKVWYVWKFNMNWIYGYTKDPPTYLKNCTIIPNISIFYFLQLSFWKLNNVSSWRSREYFVILGQYKPCIYIYIPVRGKWVSWDFPGLHQYHN